MRHSIETRQIVVNDQLINYYFLQPAVLSSGVIVFLHGWRSEGAIWLPLMERLADFGIKSYAIDLPGFGKSPAPESAWRVSDYANAVESFIKKLGVGSITLVGHSFGGRVAIKFSAAHPVMIEKLILVSSAGIKNESVMKTWKFIVAKIFKPFFAPVFMQPLRRKIYSLTGAEDYTATPQLRQIFLNAISEDLMPLLPRINADTLIVWGRKDHITPLDYAHRMSGAISKSRLTIIPDAGHFSFLDQPEKFFEVLKDFVAPIATQQR